jgi:hypothetical protein
MRPTTFPTVSNDKTLGSIPFKNRLPTGSDRSSNGATGKSPMPHNFETTAFRS